MSAGGEWPSPSGEPRKERTTSGDGIAAGELHPPTRLPSAYEQDPERAGSGSARPDAEAMPYRGPAASNAPTTDQT